MITLCATVSSRRFSLQPVYRKDSRSGSVNTLGTPGIAAYTAATRIEGFANSFGDSGGNAVSVMVSQNLGAGNHDRVKKSLFWGLMLNWTVCVVISLFMFFGSNPALRCF